MTTDDVITAVSSRPVLLGCAFLGGMFVQCLSLLRKRPPKWGIITFAGMLVYMTAMMGYAVTNYPAEYLEEKLIQVILPQMFSFGFVFTFLFIAIFLKDVVKVINEAVIFSLTLSFWFLVLHRAGDFGPLPLAGVIALGIVPTAGAIYLLTHTGELRNVFRLFFYAWYLLVNALFALAFFDQLPSGFILSGGLTLTGSETYPTASFWAWSRSTSCSMLESSTTGSSIPCFRRTPENYWSPTRQTSSPITSHPAVTSARSSAFS